MSVRIHLQRGRYDYFTNLDVIQGRIDLTLNSSESISSVVVKVEGLSKSLCYTEPGNGKTRGKTPVHELHKVLYLVDSVFPDEALKRTSTAASYTLPPGKHSWPFIFKIPINNDCKNESRINAALGTIMPGSSAALQQRHVQQILPPSMTGSEEVFVRYFIKVTVSRPSLLAVNHREYVPFIFLPIEPPRAETSDDSRAFFVKRQHTLSVTDDTRRTRGLKGMFKNSGGNRQGDTVAIELRLKNPPSLTPGIPVSMDILGFFESNEDDNKIAISKVAIYLNVITKVRANNLKRQLGSRLLCYSTDVNVLFRATNSAQPAALLSLANTKPFVVATDTPPSFSTCNITRSYELEVAVTLTHGSTKQVSEMVALTLPINVLSGVQAPSPEAGRTSQADQSPLGTASSSSGADLTEQLPSYKEAVRGGMGSATAVHTHTLPRNAIRTRTSYRVGQDYNQYPTS